MMGGTILYRVSLLIKHGIRYKFHIKAPLNLWAPMPYFLYIWVVAPMAYQPLSEHFLFTKADNNNHRSHCLGVLINTVLHIDIHNTFLAPMLS